MESKRKKRKVLKAARPLTPRQTADSKPSTFNNLIYYNAQLVDNLYASGVWAEIINPLIEEGIASVSGRKTNGRYYYGELVKPDSNRDFIAGYQKALMDLSNYIDDFRLERDKLIRKKEEAEKATNAPIINPFMESD